MNKVEQDKLFFTEAKRQITLLKKQNAEMLEALKTAYELLSPISTKFESRDTAEGQFKLASLRAIIEELK